MLPNLSALRLSAPACRSCNPAAPPSPMGALYRDIDAARNEDDDENPGCSRRTQERAGGWDEDDASCVICLGELRRPADLDLKPWDPAYTRVELVEIQALCEDSVCGHAFHAACLYRYIWRGGRNCPVCRTEIDDEVVDTADEERAEYDQRRTQFLSQPGKEALRAQYEEYAGKEEDEEEEDEDGDFDVPDVMSDTLRLLVDRYEGMRRAEGTNDHFWGLRAAATLKVIVNLHYYPSEYVPLGQMISDFMGQYNRIESDDWKDLCQLMVLEMMRSRPEWSVGFAEWRENHAAELGEVDDLNIDDDGYDDASDEQSGEQYSPFEDYPDGPRYRLQAYTEFTQETTYDDHGADAVGILRQMIADRYLGAAQISAADRDLQVRSFDYYFQKITSPQWSDWVRNTVTMMMDWESEWNEAFTDWFREQVNENLI